MVTRAQMIGMLKDAANAINTDSGASALHESDRDEAPDGRGRDAACSDSPAGNNVPRIGSSTSHASRDCGTAKAPAWRCPGKSLRDRSSSRPRRGFLFGDQLWRKIHRVADHETKPARWIQSASFGNRWNSSDPCASNTRGRSTNRDLYHGDEAGLHARSADVGSMGTKEDCLGEKAHWEDLLPDSVRRHGLSGLVPSEVHVLATAPEGLRGLLLRSTGARCSGSSTECPGQPVLSEPSIGSRLDPMVSKEIEDCRLACARFEPYHHAAKHDSRVSHALETAIHVADQVVAKSVPGRTSQPCHLLEIYAGEHSPLTDAAISKGLRAHRFSKSDGDLSTFAGRQKLWRLIDELQPEHIYVAPECGPWGGWNRLNAMKSVTLWDKINDQQNHERTHIKLCAQLCSYQVTRNRHFHLEQPSGSGMINTPEFAPIQRMTQQALFDMCAFGLKIPQTDRFIKKRSQIWTSCSEMHDFLNQRNCQHDHDHQVIAGNIRQAGESVRLSRFCATYCRGFVHALARVLHESLTKERVFAAEDEPPSKKPRINPAVFKRPRVPDRSESDMLSTAPEASGSRVLPADSLWHEACRMAHLLAPRVGNTKHEVGTDLTTFVQGLVDDDFQVVCVFICRGTDRLQVPVNAPASQQAPWRHTISIHRTTGELHDLGCHDWSRLTRAQRIAKSIPSKLTLTVFGNKSQVQSSSQLDVPPALPELESSDQPFAQRVRAESVSRSAVKLPDVCEGWAPPPTPLHGPNFRSLEPQEKSQLVLLHKNLGHPDPKILSHHLRHQGAPEHVVKGAQDFVCDTCVETRKPLHQRPAKLRNPIEFNDRIGLDGFFWTGKGQFQCYVIHVYDEASGFHLAKRLDGRNMDHVIPALDDLWMIWAGSPKEIYLDPAGEFRSDIWLNHLQSMNTNVFMTVEAWQRGRIERHGDIVKNMLHRMDHDQTISSLSQFDEALKLCCQAKNQLSKQSGYSPEQLVLGKSTKLPASLASDDEAAAHSLAIGSDLESQRFKEMLERRTQARQAFIQAENSDAIRRALLRRSCPVRGPYSPGQLVLYWSKRPKPNRAEAGRWCGPARVVLQEGTSVVWVSHADRLLRCAPENLRPASIREWSQSVNPHIPLSLNNNPPDNPPPNNALPDNPDTEYEPSLAPDHIPVTPPISEQPEQEASPPTSLPSEQDESNTETMETDQEEIREELGDNPENDALLLQMTRLPEIALVASEVETSRDAPLFSFDTLQGGSEQSQVCLAEDGLPYFEEPLECQSEECYVLEIPLKSSDMTAWYNEVNPEQMCHVAAASQRARAEVQVKTLTPEERKLFEVAKDNELSCWISTNSLKPILRQKLNPDQILRSRWVLTWKEGEAEGGKPAQRGAKARLVVLGYMDPQITNVVRDSPTLSREGRHTILQCLAAYQWELTSFDIKTAFLRGKQTNPIL